ncbi:MAG: hypothetical protein QM817_12200 [Archangium sp.]
MQPSNLAPTLVPMPANDLPKPEAVERARRRTRERRLRGPTWAEAVRQQQSA